MRGAVPPIPNTPSWRGAQGEHSLNSGVHHKLFATRLNITLFSRGSLPYAPDMSAPLQYREPWWALRSCQQISACCQIFMKERAQIPGPFDSYLLILKETSCWELDVHSIWATDRLTYNAKTCDRIKYIHTTASRSGISVLTFHRLFRNWRCTFFGLIHEGTIHEHSLLQFNVFPKQYLILNSSQ